MTTIRAVAFDFGGPVLLTPFERRTFIETLCQLEPGSLQWFGPFDPSHDVMWQQLQAGEITERDYWHTRTAEIMPYIDGASTILDVFTAMFGGDPEQAMRPEALPFLAEVLHANLTTAIFTNDLADFQSQEWIDRNPFISQVHTIVDGSITGHLKPSPRSYEILIEELALPPEQILYIDDQPMNINGGNDAGLTTVWFDVTDAAGSYERARHILGLSPTA